MIPIFPLTKPLTLEDKPDFDAFLANHHPYSDFNFISLWSYDTNDRVQVSMLNDNLVVRMQDYMDESEFLTFLGTNNQHQTILTLLDHAASQGIQPHLKLVPHASVDGLSDTEHYTIHAARDDFDYMLSVPELALLEGGRYHNKRNMAGRFERDNHDRAKVVVLPLAHEHTQAAILELFESWEQQRGKTREETGRELATIKRFFTGLTHFTPYGLGIVIDDKLAGFLIGEILNHDHAIVHFEKGDLRYPGIYEYLQHHHAKWLDAQGIKFINYEQDLGIPGLRHSKTLYNPISFLKKYEIRRATSV